MDTTKNSVEELHEQEKTSVQKQVEELFYGDCPNCGASLKGKSFKFIYEQNAKLENLKKKYSKTKPPRPDLKFYLKHNIDKVKLNEKELALVKAQVERHLPLTNQSLLATVTDKENTYCCTHCGYTFQVEFDEQKK